MWAFLGIMVFCRDDALRDTHLPCHFCVTRDKSFIIQILVSLLIKKKKRGGLENVKGPIQFYYFFVNECVG